MPYTVALNQKVYCHMQSSKKLYTPYYNLDKFTLYFSLGQKGVISTLSCLRQNSMLFIRVLDTKGHFLV